MSTPKPIPVGKLTESLLRKHPVWEFTNDDERDETMVKPIKKLPVTDGSGRLFGCPVSLADGTTAFAMLGNVSLVDHRQNDQFRTLSLFLDGREHYLSRYHDFDYRKRGPGALSRDLGRKTTQVFPISYDLSAFARGAPDCLRASIPAKPREKLSHSELIKLAVG